MSLGARTRCRRKQDSRAKLSASGRARGAGPGPGGTLVCGRLRRLSESAAQAGVAVLMSFKAPGAEVRVAVRPTRGIVPPGKTHSPSSSGLRCQERPGARGQRVLPRKTEVIHTSRGHCKQSSTAKDRTADSKRDAGPTFEGISGSNYMHPSFSKPAECRIRLIGIIHHAGNNYGGRTVLQEIDLFYQAPILTQ